jgi:hypothetical protein
MTFERLGRRLKIGAALVAAAAAGSVGRRIGARPRGA